MAYSKTLLERSHEELKDAFDRFDISMLYSYCIEQSGYIYQLERLINHPEIEDFLEGIRTEQAHQSMRWDDIDKRGPFDWFWLMGYLIQKAAQAEIAGDLDKAKHHTISSAAVLSQWHKMITQKCT